MKLEKRIPGQQCAAAHVSCPTRRPAWCTKPRSRRHALLATRDHHSERTALDSDDYDDVDHEQTPGYPADDVAAKCSSRLQQEDPVAGKPGGGFVGLFVAGWMAVLALLMQLLSPLFSLSLFVAQPLTHTNPARARAHVDKWATQLPQGFWARLYYLWERPLVKSIRITTSIASWSVRLPAIAALLLAQGGALASTISFPMLAPLLLGTGMMMNSIKANASFIIPRLGLMVVLLWVLWFLTNVVQTTWVVLRNQGRIDMRTLAGARMITECTSLLLAGIVVLSMLGINISALLLPAGVVLAIASRDLLQNFIAGFFLVLAQPFRLGDKVAVSCTVGGANSGAASSASGYSTHRGKQGDNRVAPAAAGRSDNSVMPGWFEGVCEKVDLRYTVLRDGRRRLMVPNTAFVSREFMVYDDPEPLKPTGYDHRNNSSSSTNSSWWWQHKGTSTPQEQAGTSDAANRQQPSHAERGQQSGDRQQQAGRQSPEPAIVEGHMTTQLPPLGQPLFPGMHFVAPHHPAYAPFPGLHYQQQQPLQPYQYQDPSVYSQIQQQQHDAVFGMHDWMQHEQLYNQQEQQPQEQLGPNLQQQGQHHAGSSSQQGPQHQEAPQSRQQSRPVAKGPPGYLPQGFAAGPPYLGIPVGTLYYGVPGVVPWGTGPAAGTPAGQPHQRTAGANTSGVARPPGQQQQQPRQQQSKGPQGGKAGPRGSDDGPEGGTGGGGGGGGGLHGTNTSADIANGNAKPGGYAGPPGTDAAAGAATTSSTGAVGGEAAIEGPTAAAHPVQGQAQQQPAHTPLVGPTVHMSSHSMHLAAGVGFGMWGMTPAMMPGPLLPSDGGGVQYSGTMAHPGASSIGGPYAHEGGGNSGGFDQDPWQERQGQQHGQHAGSTARSAAAPAAEGDAAGEAATEASQGSNLVMAVLQEIKRQQL